MNANFLSLNEHEIKANPDSNCPPSILARQIGLLVTYMEPLGKDKLGIIEVDKDLQNDVLYFFKTAYEIGFPIEEVTPAGGSYFNYDDRRLMVANASSGFNYRTIAGTHKLSQHALGRAIDINPKFNPYTIYDSSGNLVTTNPPEGQHDLERPGTFTSNHTLVQLMKSLGWDWGGDWTKESGRIDLHHFQKPA